MNEVFDWTRPRLENPDGSFSTEETMTIDVDGRQVLIPTIVQGQRVSPDKAVQLFWEGRNNPVAIYPAPTFFDPQFRSGLLGFMRSPLGLLGE